MQPSLGFPHLSFVCCSVVIFLEKSWALAVTPPLGTSQAQPLCPLVVTVCIYMYVSP